MYICNYMYISVSFCYHAMYISKLKSTLGPTECTFWQLITLERPIARTGHAVEQQTPLTAPGLHRPSGSGWYDCPPGHLETSSTQIEGTEVVSLVESWLCVVIVLAAHDTYNLVQVQYMWTKMQLRCRVQLPTTSEWITSGKSTIRKSDLRAPFRNRPWYLSLHDIWWRWHQDWIPIMPISPLRYDYTPSVYIHPYIDTVHPFSIQIEDHKTIQLHKSL